VWKSVWFLRLRVNGGKKHTFYMWKKPQKEAKKVDKNVDKKRLIVEKWKRENQLDP